MLGEARPSSSRTVEDRSTANGAANLIKASWRSPFEATEDRNSKWGALGDLDERWQLRFKATEDRNIGVSMYFA
ncbi:hypothetical protein ACFY9S_32890 [Streptomyces sp. NPDC012474]|uniref:hypothetical protein n=1 Tax=Streptomyces sp. NPDC012474 TaxID=3364836 RepID=UPI0036E0AAF7